MKPQKMKSKKKTKKVPHLTLTMDDIVTGMRNDFLEVVGKKEFIPIGELNKVLINDPNGYSKALDGRIEYGKSFYTGNFYIEVVSTIDPMRRTLLRRLHVARKTCATPTPGHAVWKYDRKDDRIFLLWDLPVEKSCRWLYLHRFELPPSENKILKVILDFYDGTLEARARKENNEIDDGATHRIITDEREFERISKQYSTRN